MRFIIAVELRMFLFLNIRIYSSWSLQKRRFIRTQLSSINIAANWMKITHKAFQVFWSVFFLWLKLHRKDHADNYSFVIFISHFLDDKNFKTDAIVDQWNWTRTSVIMTYMKIVLFSGYIFPTIFAVGALQYSYIAKCCCATWSRKELLPELTGAQIISRVSVKNQFD